jgi:hypothetical protein
MDMSLPTIGTAIMDIHQDLADFSQERQSIGSEFRLMAQIIIFL